MIPQTRSAIRTKALVVSIRRYLVAGALSVALGGCGQPPGARFALSDRTIALERPARLAVEQVLDEHFGTPQELVAWLRLPVDYGAVSGRVVQASEFGRFQVALEQEADATTLSAGAGLLWTSGALQQAVAVLPGGQERPVVFRVAGYDADTHELSIATDPPVAADPPAAGDSFIIAGAPLQRGRKLYMEHCMHCHGVAGDGNGPTARYLNPRPRDYRLGVFKFTSTGQKDRASREDLTRTIRQGIPGTYMPSFLMLPEQDVRDMVEYVRWLAMRGELERRLAAELAVDYSREAFKGLKADERQQLEAELKQYLESDFPEEIARATEAIVRLWEAAENSSSLVVPQIGRLESSQQIAREVSAWLAEHGESLRQGGLQELRREQNSLTLRVSFPAGRELKTDDVLLWTSGKLAGWKYRVESLAAASEGAAAIVLAPAGGAPLITADNVPGKGDRFAVADAEPPDRLAYVVRHGTDLTQMVRLAAEDVERLQRRLIDDSVRRGRSLYLGQTAKCATCHGPQGRGDGDQTLAYQKIPGTNDEYPEPGLFDEWNQKIQPRDLTRGIYRGGRRPIDLYRRIYAGIKGTPMPPFGGTALNDDEIWDIVNYVMSIPYERAAPRGETPSALASRRN